MSQGQGEADPVLGGCLARNVTSGTVVNKLRVESASRKEAFSGSGSGRKLGENVLAC